MNTQNEDEKQNLLKEHFLARATQINVDCETEFIRIGISSFIDTSPTIDKYSSWMLAGCGAIAALMVNNMKSIVPLIGANGFKISIYILVCSVLAGLFQKYNSLRIQVLIDFSKKLMTDSNSLNSIQTKAFQDLHQEARNSGIELNVGPTFDLNRIKKEFITLIPFFMRKKATEGFEKGATVTLHGWRKMVGPYKYQISSFIFQFIFFLAFLVYIAGTV